MILMQAPKGGMIFPGMPSGATYAADADGLIKITNNSVADQVALMATGCFTLTPCGGWGTYSFNLLADLYTADSVSNLLLPGTVGFPLHSTVQIMADTTLANNGTWYKTGTGNGAGNWTFSAVFSNNGSVASALTALQVIASALQAIINPGGMQAIPGLIAAITDALGNRTWLEANDTDGGPSPLSILLFKRYFSLPSTSPIAGLIYAFLDAYGNRTWLEVNDTNGGPSALALELFELAKTTTALSTFACYGDSLTQGDHGYTGSWPQDLATATGKNVIDLGISGETSVEIAICAGGVIPLLTFAGGTLPASTSSVTVTTNITTALSASGQPNRSYNVTIRSVPCVLTYNTSMAAWSIARMTAGTALVINPTCPVPAVPVTPYTANLNILWAGRNDSPISSAYANIAATVAWYQSLSIPFLVCSVTNMGSEPSGSSGYASIIALNAQIEALAPRNYVDIRGRLIREGLALAGLTPTSADATAIANDQIPPSLLWSGDGLLLHTNEYGDTAISLIMQDELTQRGWL